MASVWEEKVKMPRFPALEGNKRTRVLIIGGGMAGLLCAHMLEGMGEDYLLVEAEEPGGGVTRNTTAKITVQHGLIFRKLLREFGPERTKLYLEANENALNEYRRLCKTIDCDFQTQDSAVYSLRGKQKIEEELEALQTIGSSANFRAQLSLPFPIDGAVAFSNQAQFHPLKFLREITKELPVFEHTKVLELTPRGAVTNHGTIRAEQIIVTTHFPFLNKHGSYFLKLYQHRSYVLALKHAASVDGMYVDECESGLSFRNYGDFLLLGGGSHRTGKKGGAWQELSAFAQKYYPESKEVSRWATQDCMTLDGIPYIGRYSSRTPNLYVATGFNKWGMSSSMTAASVLTDLILGKGNPYTDVFSPSRTILRKQLAINAGESLLNLLTPTVPRCPHLGCALKYNAQEHSWDCPCHGSRFTEDGKLLNNPATDDKTPKKGRK